MPENSIIAETTDIGSQLNEESSTDNAPATVAVTVTETALQETPVKKERVKVDFTTDIASKA